MLKTEIINTGTELFLDEMANTNLAFLSNQLLEIGWEPGFHTTIPDNLNYLISAIHTALQRADLVIITGGLGATKDDLTRFAVSLAVKRELHFNQQAFQSIQRFFKRMNRPVPLNNRIQAEIPESAGVLMNSIGTAPGFWLKIPDHGVSLNRKNKVLVVLPGVPQELKEMFKKSVRPLLKKMALSSSQRHPFFSEKLLLFGISESYLQEELDILPLPELITPAITAANNGVISLRLIINTNKYHKSHRLLSYFLGKIRKRLGTIIFGADDDTMEGVVGDLLLRKKLTVAVAESCSGGLLSHKLTNIPGISAVFKEGVVTYSDEAKIKRLGINARLMKRCGAVSPEVALLMARHIALQTGADFGLGITGIAGPGGGSLKKPVGLVYLALHSRYQTELKQAQFIGNRETIKEHVATTALNMLRLKLL